MAYDEPKTRLNPLSNAPFTQTREQYTMDCAARNATLLARYYLYSHNEVTDGQDEMFPEAQAIAAADAEQLTVFELVSTAQTSLAGLPAFLSCHPPTERVTAFGKGRLRGN